MVGGKGTRLQVVTREERNLIRLSRVMVRHVEEAARSLPDNPYAYKELIASRVRDHVFQQHAAYPLATRSRNSCRTAPTIVAHMVANTSDHGREQDRKSVV